MSVTDRSADASWMTGTVTFLFTDIEGSTRLWEEEPERMRSALAGHDAASRAAVESHHGQIVKSTGDGVHAAFDDALDALGAAVELQEAIADPAATNGVPLRVRCGMHSGMVERRDNDYFGSPVNRAARIMSAAHGGQVLLSQAVAASVRDILPAPLSLRDLGKVRLKDLSAPEHVYQILHPRLRQEFPPLRSLEATPNNLPQQATSFIGREQTLAELRRLSGGTRLLTLTGSGGCGKTRLCLQIAADSLERFSDGVWMVELAPLSEADRVPQAVAMVLGLKQEPGVTTSQTLAQYLKDKRLLLLLDNCEHLLEGCARLADMLLRLCPDLALVASSREALGISGEQTYRVPSMSLPDPGQPTTAVSIITFEAVQLFADRARLTRADFEVTDRNAPALASICRRLDGIPLAIELAAARVRSLSVEEINRKLTERFRLLTRGSRAALPRQQTLRATLEWSYNLLNDDERAVFRRLGVFAGGFTMETAQAVAGDAQLDDWAVLDHLSALVDKSLVVVDAGETPRYRLLESARAFAVEQLTAGEMSCTLKRHALAMRDFMERVDNANLDGELRTDQYAALVLPELDNLRTAHDWATGEDGDVRVAIALAAHSGSLIDYAVECADWIVPLQRQVEEGTVSLALAARYWRAMAAGNLAGRIPLSLQTAAADRASSMYRELGQPRRVFSSLMRLTYYLGMQRQEAAARVALDEARSLIRPDWPSEFHLLLLRRDGFLAREAGRLSEALALFRDAVRASVSTGDWRLEVIARSNLVDLLWEMGPLEEADREASALARDLRARPAAYGDMDIVFANWMGILAESGRIAEASAVAREALPLMRRTQDYYVEAWAYLFWRRGQIDLAARLLGASDSSCVRSGTPLQPNEARLIAEVRASLASRLSGEERESGLAAGAALSSSEMVALLTEALAEPRGSDLPRLDDAVKAPDGEVLR
jgi:predicted ATPase/class 3 adenylate cyclase